MVTIDNRDFRCCPDRDQSFLCELSGVGRLGPVHCRYPKCDGGSTGCRRKSLESVGKAIGTYRARLEHNEFNPDLAHNRGYREGDEDVLRLSYIMLLSERLIVSRKLQMVWRM